MPAESVRRGLTMADLSPADRALSVALLGIYAFILAYSLLHWLTDPWTVTFQP